VRILVAGSSGRTGTPLSRLLATQGHTVVAAARSSGVDVTSGDALERVMAGVQVVIDVTSASSRDPQEISRFFETSSRALLAAGRRVGVTHHVMLSVVGADHMTGSAYMRAKIAQERVVTDGGVPYTIVRATQFFEFIAQFGDLFESGGEVRLPAARMQPIAVADVSAALATIVVGRPANGIVELGGPRVMTIRDAVARVLSARGDERAVIASEAVSYFGASLQEDTLVPGPKSLRGGLDLDEWLTESEE